MEEEAKSKLEMAMEFLNEHDMSDIPADGFQAFWEHPEKVIKLYHVMVEWLKNAKQFSPEQRAEMNKLMLQDACAEYVNLNPDES